MDLERLLDNPTLFSARCLPLDDARGRELMVVIAKIAWSVSSRGRCRPLVQGAPVRFSDVSHDPLVMTGLASYPSRSSARIPCDIIDEKPGTDVILTGTATPPEGRAVTEMDVSLRMETSRRTLAKTVRVYGTRVYYAAPTGPIPGPPARLHPTKLRYELTYGGPEEPRNTLGIGAVRDRRDLVGRLAPPIEDPSAPLTSRAPAPAGFGPLAPDWSPRRELAGTYDDTWRRTRAPIRPIDYDARHASAADPSLFSPDPLRGDEPVEVIGATREGVWRFKLPHIYPVITFETSEGAKEERPHPDTYWIDADEGRVELTFRARAPLPKKIQHIHRIRLAAGGDLPEGA